jgi:MoxR-like ATPase
MFMLDVGYPSELDEVRIVRETTGEEKPPVDKILTPARIIALQALVRRIPVPEGVVRQAVVLARATRPDAAASHLDAEPAARIKEFVSFGAGPRASQYLVLGAKARAALDGRPAATIDDVRSIAIPVLAHRIVPNFHADSSGVRTKDLVRMVLENIRS